MDNINWSEIMPLGQAIGWTVVHSLWQLMLVALFLRLLLFAIPQHLSSVRYSLALSGLIIATLLAGTTFSKEWTIAKKVQATSLIKETIQKEAVFGKSKPISIIDTKNNQKTALTTGNHSTKKETNFEAIGIQFLQQQVTQISKTLTPFIPVIAILWYLGVLVFSMLIIGGFFHLNQLKTVGIHTPTRQWQQRFEVLKRQMGITRNIQFSLSEKIVEPITFYFFKPIVLAPIGLFTQLSADQIEVLLLHELAHIRRYDFTINIFQSLIEVLFFYHPAVWWMSREIRKEREHCCDDLVISIRNNPLLYAEALTCLQSSNFSLKKHLAMSATGKTGPFSQRIFRLFGQYDQQPTALKGTFLLLLLLMTCFFTQAFYMPNLENAYLNTTIIAPLDKNSYEEPTNSLTIVEENITIAEPTTVDATVTESLIAAEDTRYFSAMENKKKTIEATAILPILTSPLEQRTTITSEQLIAEIKVEIPVNLSTSEDPKEEMEKVNVTPKPIFKDGGKVLIDWSIPENRNHANANVFRRWSPKKIAKLYKDNLKAKRMLDRTGAVSTEGDIGGLEEYESLIYTVRGSANITFDTLDTYVNHRRKLTSGLTNAIAKQIGKKALKGLERNKLFSGSHSPVRGQLPAIVKGTSTFSDSKSGDVKLGISMELTENAESVTIAIFDRLGNLVETVFDEPLKKGKHSFDWYFGDIENDTYQLDITVNGQTMSQLREVKTRKKRKNRVTNGCQSLLRAVKSGKTQKVAELLANTSPNCTYRDDGEPRSPLVAAARKGNKEITQLLLAADAKVEYQAMGDESPLIAASKYGSLEVAKLLVENGARVNREMDGDGTALMMAAKKGHLEICQYLIEKGADVNAVVHGDGTPLINAIRGQHYKITKLLLENGADVRLDSPGDENPIYHASRHKGDKFLDLLIEYKNKTK